MKPLGEYIRELRQQKDLSLRDFAKRLGGKSAAFISDIELGRRFPSDPVLEDIARVCPRRAPGKSSPARLPCSRRRLEKTRRAGFRVRRRFSHHCRQADHARRSLEAGGRETEEGREMRTFKAKQGPFQERPSILHSLSRCKRTQRTVGSRNGSASCWHELADAGGKPAERRINTTLAHEAGRKNWRW